MAASILGGVLVEAGAFLHLFAVKRPKGMDSFNTSFCI